MEHLIYLLLQCLQSRGINELLLTSDNWEGLRYGGMEGGNEDIGFKFNTCVKKIKIKLFFIDTVILPISVLKTINLQRLSFGAIQCLADMQVGDGWSLMVMTLLVISIFAHNIICNIINCY